MLVVPQISLKYRKSTCFMPCAWTIINTHARPQSQLCCCLTCGTSTRLRHTPASFCVTLSWAMLLVLRARKWPHTEPRKTIEKQSKNVSKQEKRISPSLLFTLGIAQNASCFYLVAHVVHSLRHLSSPMPQRLPFYQQKIIAPKKRKKKSALGISLALALTHSLTPCGVLFRTFSSSCAVRFTMMSLSLSMSLYFWCKNPKFCIVFIDRTTQQLERAAERERETGKARGWVRQEEKRW